MKVILSVMMLIMVSLSYGQKRSSTPAKNWGVGVKIGDPLGLTLKKYNGNKAFEFIIGRTYYWGRYDYGYHYRHDNRFKNHHRFNYVRAYDYSTPVALQLRYLVHKDIKGAPGLQWYLGAGVQFRHQTYYYEYYDGWTPPYYFAVKETDIGIGPEAVVGVEYTFKDVPISLGLDLNLYVEFVDRPFLFLLQGGLAARYNF